MENVINTDGTVDLVTSGEEKSSKEDKSWNWLESGRKVNIRQLTMRNYGMPKISKKRTKKTQVVNWQVNLRGNSARLIMKTLKKMTTVRKIFYQGPAWHWYLTMATHLGGGDKQLPSRNRKKPWKRK